MLVCLRRAVQYSAVYSSVKFLAVELSFVFSSMNAGAQLRALNVLGGLCVCVYELCLHAPCRSMSVASGYCMILRNIMFVGFDMS